VKWICTRSRRVFAASVGSGSAVLRFAGGGGIVTQRSFSRTNFPRSVADVDVGCA